jgi:hypothetical protein
VGQLVREQILSVAGVRRIVAVSEHHIGAAGKRSSFDALGRVGGDRAGMDPNATEVVAQS